MELYLNTTSPYARVACILLMEKGLISKVTLKWCDPWADDAELLKVNPAGRVPALVTNEGITLSESTLLAVYLDGAFPKTPMLPDNQRAQVLHLAGLGQNLMEAAFNIVIARKHDGHKANESMLGQRRWRALHRLLPQLESELGDTSPAVSLHLGEITTAVALAYLDFRLPEAVWQRACPKLGAWHAGIEARASFQQTAFV
ncbi:glutathione S-transferase N-terminal domain-containing protein [Halomonas malpeensis]|uniref:Glutathione S-transferase N-terminal domain-containing protein n=2 Tax=Vreelandella malpeensis TaxID=1172368 RepID=A0ABS8DMS2_9GAMM|nr:glutathione S-transferase N-terminal domain-containing protein [Halomonas malpeensis]